MTLDVPSCLSIANHIRYWDGIHAQDAEDFIHDALLEMMERARRNGGGLTDKEMWRAARCVRNILGRPGVRLLMKVVRRHKLLPATVRDFGRMLARL